jgi:arylsulfatase A-like enzyme
MQAYCADVTAMDNALGRLFSYLEESGRDENTVVVFTSDNGPGPLTPQVKSQSVVKRYKEKPTLLNSVGSARIYRERKISLHDGGIRVPFIVSWPQQIKKGKLDSESVIHGTDWLPTVASICNVELPNGQYDGRDVKSAFLGKEMKNREAIYWKQNRSLALLQNNWKCLINEDGEFQLYDIKKDPSEITDLKKVYPELARELKTNLLDWQKNIVN